MSLDLWSACRALMFLYRDVNNYYFMVIGAAAHQTNLDKRISGIETELSVNDRQMIKDNVFIKFRLMPLANRLLFDMQGVNDLFGISLELWTDKPEFLSLDTLLMDPWFGADIISYVHKDTPPGKLATGVTRKSVQGVISGSGNLFAENSMRHWSAHDQNDICPLKGDHRI